jgi:RNA-binding protein YhbY
VKIRSDYVTNSSSSSFILAFSNEDSIYKTLKEQFPEDIVEGWSAGEEGYFNQLIDEIDNAKRLTREDLIKIFNQEKYSIRRELIRELVEKRDGMDYCDAYDYLKTEDGNSQINKVYEKRLEKFLKDIGDNKVIVEVEHGDGGEGEDGMLERKILPRLGCTIKRFSHH